MQRVTGDEEAHLVGRTCFPGHLVVEAAYYLGLLDVEAVMVRHYRPSVSPLPHEHPPGTQFPLSSAAMDPPGAAFLSRPSKTKRLMPLVKERKGCTGHENRDKAKGQMKVVGP